MKLTAIERVSTVMAPATTRPARASMRTAIAPARGRVSTGALAPEYHSVRKVRRGLDTERFYQLPNSVSPPAITPSRTSVLRHSL